MTDHTEVNSFFNHLNDKPKKIDHYNVVKSLGSGGMGEVFLVYDPQCERYVALKKIKSNLISHPIIKKRFMKEARFASKLAHPNIIPIYAIHEKQNNIYYTMPYIEGETLKEIITATKLKDKKGEAPHEIGISIPSLTRIFLSTCQAVAYSHSYGVLHRDLKPENIIVGKFGEVFLLDWGIATDIKKEDFEEEDVKEDNPHLTSPGKILGTVNYMAPERAYKKEASISTEIYSLGVILYQILTLTFPFRRKNIDHFKRIMKFERIFPPEEQAPYRDIPKQLSNICLKSLSYLPEHRYQNVDEMIHDLKNYIEGKPEWILTKELNIYDKKDWEFQENIPLSKHMAITQIIDFMEWVALMISKKPFPGNIKMEFDLKLSKQSSGVGILLCVPEQDQRKDLHEGFCLWIGSQASSSLTLFRSNAELYSICHLNMSSEDFSKITIEKVDNSLKFYVDDHIKLNYVSHLPIIGTHLGFCYKDPHFEISSLKVYTGSQHVMVNCLSIPDILLSSKNFSQAFVEYKKIAQSLDGRTEAREAQFRAGLTLLEEAKQKQEKDKAALLSKAFDEFEKLKGTPAAPLEYLGKSLIYNVEKDIEEEIKSLELCIRKFSKHPLLQIIKEQVIFRLHESSNINRKATYLLALIALRLTPEIFISHENSKLMNQLAKHALSLDFIDLNIALHEKKITYLHLAMVLAFWVKKPKILCEIFDKIPENLPEKKYLITNGLFCLFYMGFKELAFEKHRELHHHLLISSDQEALYCLKLFELVQSTRLIDDRLSEFFSILPQQVERREFRVFLILINIGLNHLSSESLLKRISLLFSYQLTKEIQLELTLLQIKVSLYFKKLDTLSSLFDSVNQELLQNAKSPFSFYYGCFLALTKGKKQVTSHFEKLKSCDLLPISLAATIGLEKMNLETVATLDLFDFERYLIYDYLELYYQCLGKKKKVIEMQKLKELS